MRERRQKLKDKHAEQVLRVNRIQELKEFLLSQENGLTKFEEVLFRRMVEKAKFQPHAFIHNSVQNDKRSILDNDSTKQKRVSLFDTKFYTSDHWTLIRNKVLIIDLFL